MTWRLDILTVSRTFMAFRWLISNLNEYQTDRQIIFFPCCENGFLGYLRGKSSVPALHAKTTHISSFFLPLILKCRTDLYRMSLAVNFVLIGFVVISLQSRHDPSTILLHSFL